MCGATDGGRILPDDEVPASIMPLLAVFFEEMWPVLKSSMAVLTAFIASGQHERTASLPFKSFYSPAQFRELQSKGGALSHEFELGGVRESRMVSAYQVWMLCRLSDAMNFASTDAELTTFLARIHKGTEILELPDRLTGCHLRKHFEQLYVDGG
jgi:hypothetical protein